MTKAIWILGATGRSGSEIARRLDAAGVPLVLAGRDRGRLDRLAAELSGTPRLAVGSLESILGQLSRDGSDASDGTDDTRPGVVINTVGPFTQTAVQVARACPPGTHYVDIANELAALEGIFALDRMAAADGQVLVAAAGFGVVATESVVLRLMADEAAAGDGSGPSARPTHVRVDALASVALEEGAVGTVLAGTIVEVMTAPGREVRGSRFVRSATGSNGLDLTTPDGNTLHTGGGASGDLIAAWRASGADSVVAASTFAPSNRAVLAVLPLLSATLRIPVLGRFATARIARVPMHAKERLRTSSWGHARIEWASGRVREGWLRVGDGSLFTADSAAEIAQRLLRGEGTPGAHTPGELFGAELAEDLGGEFVIER
jgi:short subunit dehydrogenase-like uncharacterized protein